MNQASAVPAPAPDLSGLLAQYGCGPIQFTGTDGLYGRHLLFDNVIDPAAADMRDRFEAAARSVRDVLSQRWVRTQDTYERQDPKRVYYLSMEFLIGRALANNVINLRLDPVVAQIARQHDVAWRDVARGGARRGPGQWRARAAGGLLPRLDGHHAAACDGLRAALRVRHLQAIHPGRLAERAPGQLAAPGRPVGSRASARAGGDQAQLLVRRAWRNPAGDPRSPVEPDRDPVRPAGGGLRRQDGQHAAVVGGGCARLLRLPGVQPRRVRRRGGRDAGRRIADARPLPGRFDQPGSGAALHPGVFPGGLLAGRPGAPFPARQQRLEQRCPTRSPFSSTTRIRPWRCPS